MRLFVASATGAKSVSPNLAMPDAVGLIERREELSEVHASCTGKAVDHVHCGGLAATFEVGQVGPVQPGPVGQFLLRQLKGTSQFPDSGSQRQPQIVHGGIVPSLPLRQP